MLVILPIRTESDTRVAPRANVFLITLNLGIFLLMHNPFLSERPNPPKEQRFAFQSDEPALYQFLTYQFLHADAGHLLGNMVCLWVFGCGVNGKLGDLPYLLFYLSGGVFAAWGYATARPATFELIGASGAIAAVTTAYLALFPRSRVTTLVWFLFFIQFLELPAMLLIGLKIIVWDNIVSPTFGGPAHVAYGAHLAGYCFGFVAGLVLLLLRAVPRDQFDIIAVWRRWYKRREMRSVTAARGGAGFPFGTVAREEPMSAAQWQAEQLRLDGISDLRSRIVQALADGDASVAVELHGRLMGIDSRQCLSELHQLAIARELYAMGRHAEAAAAFSRFVECYPATSEAPNVRLLLGIILARDLRQLEAADAQLTQSLGVLRDTSRREQCLQWLRDVRLALGRPVPEV